MPAYWVRFQLKRLNNSILHVHRMPNNVKFRMNVVHIIDELRFKRKANVRYVCCVTVWCVCVPFDFFIKILLFLYFFVSINVFACNDTSRLNDAKMMLYWSKLANVVGCRRRCRLHMWHVRRRLCGCLPSTNRDRDRERERELFILTLLFFVHLVRCYGMHIWFNGTDCFWFDMLCILECMYCRLYVLMLMPER